MQYILEQGVCHGTVFNSCHTSSTAEKNPLTEIQEGELYLCLEHRTVRVRERIINLTSKEFDILALLIYSSFGYSSLDLVDAFAILTRDGAVLLSDDAKVTFEEDAMLSKIVKNMIWRREEMECNKKQ